MATIEKYYLPPLNLGTTLTEADRSKVYEIIRRQPKYPMVASVVAGASADVSRSIIAVVGRV
jgi:hypothetical protein